MVIHSSFRTCLTWAMKQMFIFSFTKISRIPWSTPSTAGKWRTLLDCLSPKPFMVVPLLCAWKVVVWRIKIMSLVEKITPSSVSHMAYHILNAALQRCVCACVGGGVSDVVRWSDKHLILTRLCATLKYMLQRFRENAATIHFTVFSQRCNAKKNVCIYSTYTYRS